MTTFSLPAGRVKLHAMVASPSSHWQLRSRTLELGPLPCLMGIINVTPDSFSDGGQFLDPRQAVEQGLRLAEAGAGILDVGGESTRPGSRPVEQSEEMDRVLPVVEELCQQLEIPVSIDTSKAEVARQATSRPSGSRPGRLGTSRIPFKRSSPCLKRRLK